MVNFLRIRTLMLLVALFALANSASAQVASKYSFSQASGTYTPITGGTSVATATGASLGASLDDINYTLPTGTIPFAFPFNGTTYTGLVINTNGFITFGTTAPGGGLYTPISSNTGYAGAISALTLDLNSLYTSLDTGNISYVARGTTPNQEFVIQYKNFRPYSTSTGILDFWRWNFQIILHENGVINVVYDLGFVGAPTSGTGEVGLRGPNNTFATNVNNRRVVSGTNTWVTSVNGITNASTAAFSTTIVPPSGHNYIYTPVTNNIQVKSLLTPVAANCLGTTESVTVRIVNTGVNAADLSVDPLNVSATVSGTLNQTISTSVNTGSIAAGDSLTVNVGTLNLSSGGVFNFVIAGKRAGDQQITDDTLKTSVTTLVIASLPLSNPFTGFTGANLTTVQPLWREGAGATLPAGTTSRWRSATGLGGAGNTTATLNLFTNDRTEWIVGPLINVGANDSLSVDVAVTNFNSVTVADAMGSDDKVAIMVTTNCGVSWSPFYSFTATNNLTKDLTKYSFSLSAYAGQKIGIAFFATDGPLANAEDYDFHIDNINVFSAGADLIAPVVASAANNPSVNQCAPAARIVSVTVTDAVGVKEVTLTPSFGGVTQTAVALTLSTGTAQNGVWTGTIPAAGNNVPVTYTLSAKDTTGNISSSFTGTGYSDGNIGAVNAGLDQTVSQGSTATLNAASNTTFAGLRFTEVTQYETGTGQTPAYPAYIVGNDMVEITNLGTEPTLLDNVKLNVVGGTTVSYTFPAGIVVAPNQVVVVNLGAGTNNLANRYFNTGGTNDVLSSGTATGYYLTSPSGTILDAVATNGYTFLVGTGVTTSDWSGNLASSSGLAGVRRTVAADNNLSSDWTLSSASNLQNVGTLNAGLNSITVTSAIVWNPGAVTTNPYTTPVFNTTGVFDYVASVIVGGCTSTDTVQVTVIAAAAPVADFSASDSTVSTVDVVTFTDSTLNLPTSWAWSFTPGTVTYQNGTSATSQNPQVIFNTPGLYTVQLVATNNTGSDTEIKTSFISVVLGYCQPVPGTVNTVDAIAKIVITNYVPDSLVQTSTTNGVDNYDFYTTDTIDLTQTTASTISMIYGTDGNQYGAAWIDYNQNGIFEASENLLLTTVSAGSGDTVKVSFVVPNTATLGLTRIRFRGGDDSPYTAGGACAVSAYGETEDYLVNIVAAAACTNPPVAGVVSGDTAACAKQPLTLTLSGNTIGTTIQWQTSTDSLAWTDVAGATSLNYIDTNLTVAKFYRAKVICSDSSFTAGHKVSITPLLDCYCTPLGDCASYDDLIESVTFDSIDNQFSACGDLVDGYSFHPQSQFTTTVLASSSYDLTVLTGPGFALGNSLVAYIDFNRNGSFNDQGEYFLISDDATENTEYTLSIAIPATADTGQTLLRVKYVYGDLLGAGDACTNINFDGGETEDYVITIKPAPVCTTSAEAGVISGPAVGLANTNANYVAVGADGDTYKWEFSFNLTTFTTLSGAVFNNDSITVGLGTADTVYIRVVALRPGCPNDTSALFQTIITLPGNDVCDPLPLTFGTNGPFINTAATAQVGEVAPPNTGFNSTQTGWASTALTNTMWFTFVAPASGHVTIQSPDYDTQLALWDVSACGDLLDISKATLIAANDDDSAYVRHGGVQFSSFIDTVKCLVPGRTYYVQLDGYSAGGDTTRIILNDGGYTSDFALATTTYCTNDAPVVLLPNRSGGTFGGSGVVGSTFTPSSLAPGTYQVFYTRNCDTTFKTVVINGAPSLSAVSTNIACFGNATGAIDVTISGGTTPYTSVWSNGATTEDLTNLVAGTYTDTVTGGNGCKTILAPVTITQPAAALTATLDSVVNVSCNGAGNGAVYVTVTGGTGTPTFTWNAITGSEDLTGVNGGIYTLIATDANSCSVSSGPYTVAEPAALVTVVDLVKSISCNGAGDGYINTTTTGGTTPYTYLWSNSANTDDITGLTANTYSLVVTDAKGCTSGANGTITEPTLLTVTVDSSNNIDCFGNAVGDVYVTVAGGTTPYTSVWSNGATTDDLVNVVAGTYSDTITDANGCKVVAGPVTLTQPATGLSVSLDSAVSTTCNGASNGAVYVTVTGVTGTATYTWNNVAGTEDLTSVAAGNYTLVVSDASSCTATGGPFTVTQPAVLATIVDSVRAITCNGAANGAIYTTTTGGTTPYTYIWSNTGSSDDITGLTANNYTLAVSDAKGCTSSASSNLTEPLPLTVTIDSSKNVNCFGDATGAVYTTVAGGTTPYTYVWTNSASVSGDLTGLTPNTYTVVATDVNGCTASSTPGVVTGPASAISNAVDSTLDVKCNGGNTGAVFTTTTGGTSPYTYLWNNSASVEDIANLAAGTYTLVSTDSKGCKDTVSATITAPAALSVSTAATPQIGSTKGSVTTTVSGGTPTYTYAWTPGGATSPDLDTVNAGIYTVLITDANGCTATAKDTVDFISGVNNLVSVKTLRMYPNPTMGSAVVEISLTDVQDIKIEVLDVNGHLVSTRTERNIINATFPINIAGEAAGTYLVRIHTKDGLVTKSLILQK